MLLVVATRGRADRQITLDSLIAAGLRHQTVVVGTNAEDIPKDWSATQTYLTPGCANLTEKRNEILRLLGEREKMIVFDDDLRFSNWNGERYSRCTPEELHSGITAVWNLLDTYPLAGCLAKFIARTAPESIVEVNGKVWHMIGTNFSLVQGECPRFHGVLHQDTEMNIQMLYNGYRTAVYTHMTHEDIPNKPGGCSIYRNAAMKARVTLDLMTKYPGFVSMTDMGAERVAWSKLKKRCEELRAQRGLV